MSELDPKGPYWRIKDGTKIEAPVVGVVELNKNSGKGDTLIVSGNWEFDGV